MSKGVTCLQGFLWLLVEGRLGWGWGWQFWEQRDQLGGFWTILVTGSVWSTVVVLALARVTFCSEIKLAAFADGLEALMGRERWWRRLNNQNKPPDCTA